MLSLRTSPHQRPLDEIYPCLILDARYEKVREGGVIRFQAVLLAIGINRERAKYALFTCQQPATCRRTGASSPP